MLLLLKFGVLYPWTVSSYARNLDFMGDVDITSRATSAPSFFLLFLSLCSLLLSSTNTRIPRHATTAMWYHVLVVGYPVILGWSVYTRVGKVTTDVTVTSGLSIIYRDGKEIPVLSLDDVVRSHSGISSDRRRHRTGSIMLHYRLDQTTVTLFAVGQLSSRPLLHR